ncbi:hypothetical protein C5167_050025 [Papaver somniferum]|uniref:HORMA domain-containing protein n=1 Tax=Papaver somniferum TaxID=3469 RepID=A0A4Y7KNV9_PAPSO|nr:hypothetical protein C5167_050025 [Papaver somniferum]
MASKTSTKDIITLRGSAAIVSEFFGYAANRVSKEKSDKEIMREIQAIMRQIASSITYLPCLDEQCIFDVLAYTDAEVAVPFTWIESDPKLIANPQMVKLHSFDTKRYLEIMGSDCWYWDSQGGYSGFIQKRRGRLVLRNYSYAQVKFVNPSVSAFE